MGGRAVWWALGGAALLCLLLVYVAAVQHEQQQQRIASPGRRVVLALSAAEDDDTDGAEDVAVRAEQPAARKHAGLPFTLLVSATAPGVIAGMGAHQAEILAALQANMVLGNFAEVLVLFEEAPAYRCTDFEADMAAGARALLQALKGQRALDLADPLTSVLNEPRAAVRLQARPSRLRCVAWARGQPTYRDLFDFMQVQRSQLATDLVVLANTDLVFDATLSHLRHVPPLQIHTVSVNAAGHTAMPLVYTAAMAANGQPADKFVATCDAQVVLHGMKSCHLSNGDSAVRRPSTIVQTWDAYVLNTSSFDHAAIRMPRAKLDFYMNMVRAESNALCQLVQAGWQPTNTCTRVRGIHFHCAPKHHNITSELPRIPLPGCAWGEFRGGQFFLSAAQAALARQPPALDDQRTQISKIRGDSEGMKE